LTNIRIPREIWFFLSQTNVTFLHKTILSFLVIGASAGFFCTRAQAQGPITGRITFAGSVELNAASVNNATMVTAWHGPGPGDKPQVQSRDGDFATSVNVFDDTTFTPTWTFNSGAVSNFWSVDGFQFDLTASGILQQGQGFLLVTGTGFVSKTGFATTPGTWSFTSQDPAASGEFSFSGSTRAVPEGSTVALLGIGALGMVSVHLFRKKHKTT
jgi:hypothetical protein